MRSSHLACACMLLFAAARLGAQAQLPPHFERVQIAGPYTYGTALRFAPDGTLFVSLKDGRVRAVQAGVAQTVSVIDLSSEVNLDGDRGLNGIALHPGFVPDGGPNSWIYLAYVVSPKPGEDVPAGQNGLYAFGRITRYKIATSGGLLLAQLDSRQVLLGEQLPSGSAPLCVASLSNSHSFGALQFGTDGTLLVSAGDGGHYEFLDAGGHDDYGFDDLLQPASGLSGAVPKSQDRGALRAQSLDSFAGKILRLDPATGLGLSSNPFYDGNPNSSASRVWALGLRNPFQTALVPGTGSSNPLDGAPGELLAADVGWADWEELDRVRGGENFRWPCYEGFGVQPAYNIALPAEAGTSCATANPGLPCAPLLAWHHTQADWLAPAGLHLDASGAPGAGFSGSCAIAGDFYTGGSYPDEYDGRLFFADYGAGWIRSARFDAQGALLAVQDFGSELDPFIGFQRDPSSGDLCFLALQGSQAYVYRLRYTQNLTPLAKASASPLAGPLPLAVNFDGSASFDLDGDPLSFAWNFGDGQSANGASAQHTYTSQAAYTATLTVSDPLGVSSSAEVEIFAGNLPPQVVLTSPLPGALFASPSTLQLSGYAFDPEDGPLGVSWEVSLYHDEHVHPGVFVSNEAQTTFSVAPHGEDDELYYYRIELSATDSQGLKSSTHLFVYGAENLVDLSGLADPIARVFELAPIGPQGAGNRDIEVVRDGQEPAQGSQSDIDQFDSYHFGDQGLDDWIGYELRDPPEPEQRFVGLRFQEGKHFPGGGWFDDLWVETRIGGTWVPVENLRISPDYPFALAAQSGFDGHNYDVYELSFDPAAGDALRLRGNPGGLASFLSCGELRARAVVHATHDHQFQDITSEGTVVAKVFTLVPPVPLGDGSQSKETLRNGTMPKQGSASEWAQVDTFHNGDQGNDDWVGYTFTGTRNFARLFYQEGLNFADGGGFVSVAVEVRNASGAWVPVAGVSSTPPYLDATGQSLSYQSFTFDFPPVLGTGLRLRGDPTGTANYSSVAELRVYTAGVDEACAWQSYGAAAGANTLTLTGNTAGALGLSFELGLAGAKAGTTGQLGISAAPLSLPLLGGILLIDPTQALVLPVLYGSKGKAAVTLSAPAAPELVGATLYFQALALTGVVAQPFAFSNGLALPLCLWP